MEQTSVWSRTKGADQGFSLIELVVASALLMLVVATIATIFVSVQRTSVFANDRAQTLDDMQVAFDRITREARQAYAISPSSTGTRLEMDTYVLGSSTHVVYVVNGTILYRQAGTAAQVPLQTNLSSPVHVFDYIYPAGGTIADSSVVSITLSVFPQRRPDTTVVLNSQVSLRNKGS